LISLYGKVEAAARLCSGLLWLIVGFVGSRFLKRSFSKAWALGIILFGPIGLGSGLLLSSKSKDGIKER
jgi:hypothetical protein